MVDFEQYQKYLKIELVDGIQQEGEFELELEVFEENDGFRLNFKYDPTLFDEAFIERLTECYKKLAAKGHAPNLPN